MRAKELMQNSLLTNVRRQELGSAGEDLGIDFEGRKLHSASNG